MCRILAMASKRPISSSFIAEFRLLAEKGMISRIAREPGHKDGWGILLYQKGEPVYLGRQPTDAMKDPRYETACESLDKSGAAKGPLLAQLRKASPEYGEKTMENTAPFVREEWSFVHNGTIRNFTEKVAGLKGTTDSERFFLLVLRMREEDRLPIERALKLAIKKVRKSYKYSSLTFLLTNGARIYAYREYSDPRDSDYYNLMFVIDSNMIIISQEKLWFRDWVTIPNGALVTVLKNQKIYLEMI